MIGIDGSSSIDKKERILIGQQLLDFVRKSGFTRDSNTMCIVEFGSDVLSVVESQERSELIDALQKYKRDKNHKSKFTTWTSWSIAFDEALRRKPELLIFITDGWSNWNGRPVSFSAQYESLLYKCNALKANGTRLLFITSEIDSQNNSKTILSNFLNGDGTREIKEHALSRTVDLKDIDLITLKGFAKMEEINFSSILHCPVEIPDISSTEEDVFASVIW
jgi:hypothetical protein